MYVHLLDLSDRMRHEVDLDVVEPDPLVFSCGLGEAAVVGLVSDLDQSILLRGEMTFGER